MAEEKKKCVINKHFVLEQAQRKHGPLVDMELDLYFKGYIKGIKDIFEPLGCEVVIDD